MTTAERVRPPPTAVRPRPEPVARTALYAVPAANALSWPLCSCGPAPVGRAAPAGSAGVLVMTRATITGQGYVRSLQDAFDARGS